MEQEERNKLKDMWPVEGDPNEEFVDEPIEPTEPIEPIEPTEQSEE